MKIAIICDVLGAPNNGTTIAATNLIEYLKSKGHSVTVVCADPDKRDKEGYSIVPTYNLGPLNKILKVNGVTLAKPKKEVLARAIARADVVHVELPFALGRSAAKIAKALGKPLTASFHCQAENFTAHIFSMNNKLLNSLTYRNFYNHVFRYCDCVHYPTQFIRDLFEKEIGTATNGVVISNGVNAEFFEAAQETKRIRETRYNARKGQPITEFNILCTGRFSGEKAQHVLIEAAAKSKYKHLLRLTFTGSGPKGKKYEKLSKKLGVNARFKFMSRAELIEAQRAADLYVHTAIVEIEALSCTEAIVNGLVPVICDSKRSATRNFALDENNLFPEGNSAALAEKIDFWIENPDLLEEYRQRYSEKAGTFDQSACMKKMEEMLEKAAEQSL